MEAALYCDTNVYILYNYRLDTQKPRDLQDLEY